MRIPTPMLPWPDGFSPLAERRPWRGGRAFTLLELLVVIAIIGIIARLALPVVGKLAKPKGMATGTRQVLDDLSYARSLALSTRSTVFFVLVPTNVYTFTNALYTPQQASLLTNLVSFQYRGYALYQRRSVGDQPGQSNPRYLTEWRRLPDLVFFPPAAYDNNSLNAGTFDRADFRFPTVDSPPWTLHFVAFNPQGQMVHLDALGDETAAPGDARIPLTEGSIFNPANADGTYQLLAADVLETTPGQHTNLINRVTVNWVTGRGRIEKPELQ